MHYASSFAYWKFVELVRFKEKLSRSLPEIKHWIVDTLYKVHVHTLAQYVIFQFWRHYVIISVAHLRLHAWDWNWLRQSTSNAGCNQYKTVFNRLYVDKSTSTILFTNGLTRLYSSR